MNKLFSVFKKIEYKFVTVAFIFVLAVYVMNSFILASDDMPNKAQIKASISINGITWPKEQNLTVKLESMDETDINAYEGSDVTVSGKSPLPSGSDEWCYSPLISASKIREGHQVTIAEITYGKSDFDKGEKFRDTNLLSSNEKNEITGLDFDYFKTYIYKLSLDSTGDEGIITDDKDFFVRVNVFVKTEGLTDNAVKTVVSCSRGLSKDSFRLAVPKFTNGVSTNIKGKVEFSKETIADSDIRVTMSTDKQFVNVVESAEVSSLGDFVINHSLNFDDEGQSIYYLRQDVLVKNSYTLYDTDYYKLIYNITEEDDERICKLECKKIDKDGELDVLDNNIKFGNIVINPGYIDFTGSISCAGKDIKDAEYSFKLKDIENGKVSYIDCESDGKIVFDHSKASFLSYDLSDVNKENPEKTFEYRIDQISDSDLSIKLDDRYYKIYVTVTLSDSNTISAKVTDVKSVTEHGSVSRKIVENNLFTFENILIDEISKTGKFSFIAGKKYTTIIDFSLEADGCSYAKGSTLYSVEDKTYTLK